MDFIEVTKEDFELYSSSLTLSTWKMTKNTFDLDIQENSATITNKIVLNKIVLAFIEFSHGIYSDCTVAIDNFEVLLKGNGHGSEIITFLKQELGDCVLELYSYSEESDQFWEKHGFIKYDDGTGTPIYRFNTPS